MKKMFQIFTPLRIFLLIILILAAASFVWQYGWNQYNERFETEIDTRIVDCTVEETETEYQLHFTIENPFSKEEVVSIELKGENDKNLQYERISNHIKANQTETEIVVPGGARSKVTYIVQKASVETSKEIYAKISQDVSGSVYTVNLS